ncbi:PAS domain S-box protein [Desulfobulbus sp.]|uniref:PAS domain S-box protein n=1 Tax=Desulfobulbus sp. TaxID=895 RepID=UPI00286F409E|nr:PAS domain S-box protein [Desulfobulbus sp.]
MPELEKTAVRGPDERERLIGELRSHRIELEKQNEELRLARAEVEAGLQKYYELYDCAPIGYCTVDAEGMIRESNLAGALLLGVDRVRLLGGKVGDFVTETSRDGLVRFLERSFSPDNKAVGEIRVPDGEGSERYLYLEGSSFETVIGERHCRIAMMDITTSRQNSIELEHYRYHLEELVQQRTCELEAANTLLREQAENMNSIYQALDSIGLIVCHLEEDDARIDIFSAGAEKLFGYNQKEVIGRSLRLIVPPEGKAAMADQVGRLRRGVAMQSSDMTLTRRSGVRFPAVASIHPFARHAGRFTRAVGAFRDISELMLIHEKLQSMNDELELRVKERTAELHESNVALKVLLNKREEDKVTLSGQILANSAKLVEPYLERLLSSGLNEQQRMLVEILRANIEELTVPFANAISSKLSRLTPAEIQVANLVKLGKRTKEIAEIMRLSPGTISIHRKNIRRKLELTHKKTNLQTMLSTTS